MNSINEELLSAYQAAGATSVNINDAEAEVLIAQGAADGKWDTFLRAQGLSGSTNDMLMEYLTGRGYSGSINEMIIAAATAHDLFTPPVSTFDPATLPFSGPGVIRRWWHADEAVFLNGAVPAVPGVPGDPVSRVETQALVASFHQNYYAGSSPTYRNDGPGNYLELPSASTIMLTSFPSGVTPKDDGITFFGKYLPGAGAGINDGSWLFGEDYSPYNNGCMIYAPGTVHLRVYGNAGSYTDSPDLSAYVAGGGQTLGYILVPDSGGNCTVKFYTDSATPVGTGTVTSTGSFSRSIEKGTITCSASFFAGQDFSANVDDILTFLNNGSGA